MSPKDAEELAQRDPLVRAARLARFKAATEGMIWWRDPIRHIDVLVRPVPNVLPATDDPFANRHVA